MAKERLIGLDELERRLFNQDDRLFSHNIRNEIVDRNIDFEEK